MRFNPYVIFSLNIDPKVTSGISAFSNGIQLRLYGMSIGSLSVGLVGLAVMITLTRAF